MKPVRINKNVYITLEDGEAYEYQSGGKTDEGYDVTHYEYIRNDSILTLTRYRNALDCEGPLRSTTVLLWPVDGPVNEYGYPIFEEQSSSIYDAYAQAANY